MDWNAGLECCMDWSAGMECWNGSTGTESLEWSTGGHNEK